jgi:hypothetical protein
MMEILSDTLSLMHYRPLGRTGWKVSEISFGAWAIDGAWGNVSDVESLAALHQAIDSGVNFLDTADVYGMGRSERLIAQLKRERKDEIVVATKAGRRLNPHTAGGYNASNPAGYIEDSLRNLSTDCLDLVQLHCPPTDVYYRPEVFGALDDLIEAGKIHYYGVSVERVEEALKAIELAAVYTDDHGTLKPADGDPLRKGWKYPTPEGGLYSTASDLIRFYQMMLNKGNFGVRRVLSPAPVELMTTVQSGDLKAGFAPGLGYGLGWGIVKDANGIFRYNSIGTYAHGGAYRTYAFVDPKRDLIGIILYQRTNGAAIWPTSRRPSFS